MMKQARYANMTSMSAAHYARASFFCASFKPFHANFHPVVLDTIIMVSIFVILALALLIGAQGAAVLSVILICLTLSVRGIFIRSKEQPYFV